MVNLIGSQIVNGLLSNIRGLIIWINNNKVQIIIIMNDDDKELGEQLE